MLYTVNLQIFKNSLNKDFFSIKQKGYILSTASYFSKFEKLGIVEIPLKMIYLRMNFA